MSFMGNVALRSVVLGGGDKSLRLSYDLLQSSGSPIDTIKRRGPVPTFTRASSGWHFNESGILVEATTNTPRFDHDPVTGAALGLLIEGARTNKLVDSQNITDASVGWVKLGTPIESTTTGLDGVADSANIIEDDTAVSTEGVTQTVTITSNSSDLTTSIFIKKDSNESRFPGIVVILTGGTEVSQNTKINTVDGSITTSALSDGSHEVQDWGDWWRVIQTVTNDGNTTAVFRLFGAVDSDMNPGDSNANGQGATTFFGAQLEEVASVPSTYIHTTTDAVTRSADVCSTADVSWLNASAGTMFVQGSIPFVSAAERSLFTIDDGTVTDRLRLYMDAAENINFETINLADTDGASAGAAVIAADTTFKAAGAYDDDDVIAAVDGTLSGADTAAGIPVTDAATIMRIGNDSAGTPFNGHIQAIKYWNVRKPDGFLVSKTAG